MKRAVAVFGLAMLLTSIGYAFDANMFVFAVTESEEGIPANLTVNVKPGNGDIAIDLGRSIVGELTQESIRNAITAAVNILDVDKNAYDFFVKIDSPADKIDGPSAGLAIAITTYGAITGKDVPDTISATGQIDADGTVYPVGGVFPKAKTAHEVGVNILLIPTGERNTLAKIEEEVEPSITRTVEKTIDVVNHAKQNWNMDIYEVGGLEEAVDIVFNGKRPDQNVVHVEREVIDDFVPPPAPVMNSKEFEAMARNLVAKARKALNEAHSCSLTLRDHKLEMALKYALKTADSMVRRAAVLADNGYYYTAANYAFLAAIDADTYGKICERPSLLNPTSIAFQDLIEDTKNRIDTLETELLDANLNKNNLEWIGAARNRFIRAKYSFEMFRSEMGMGNTTSITYVRKLISIREWIESAKEMYRKGSKIDGPQIGDLEELAKQAIITVEDISEMVEIPDESIQERIAWAKTAYNIGWHYTASMEAASAKGLALGKVIADKKDPMSALAELFANPFEQTGIWDELYQNHARYYYGAAKFYKKQGKDKKAKDFAATGLQLYNMAEEIKKVNDSVHSAPTIVIHVEREVKSGFEDKGTLVVAIAVLIISAALMAILLATSNRKNIKKQHEEILKEHKYKRKIAELERKLGKLEKKLKTDMDNKEVKKEIAKIKRLLGRYRSILEKITSGGA